MFDNARVCFLIVAGTMLTVAIAGITYLLPLAFGAFPVEATLTAAPAAEGAAITTAGVLEVGRDVESGTYQTYAPAGCHWAVLVTDAGDEQDGRRARAGGGEEGGAIAVRLTSGDQALVTVGCGNWVTA